MLGPFPNRPGMRQPGKIVLLAVLSLSITACDSDGGGNDGKDTSSKITTTNAGDNAGKPLALPSFSSLNLYASDAPINVALPTKPVIDPNSANYVAKIAQFVSDPDTPPVLAYGQYSSTVFIANADTTAQDEPPRVYRRLYFLRG